VCGAGQDAARAIIEKLHGDLRAVLDEADVREEFIMRPGSHSGTLAPPPDELKRFVATEIIRFGDIVRENRASPASE